MSLCPNLWVIVSTCITKWAQSHLGSLRKSEHGCHRVTLEDHYTFHGNTSLKTEGCTRGITLCTKPSYFYTDRHTREDEAMFNLWCSSWKGLQLHAGWRGVGERGRCQRSSEDHSEMISPMKLYCTSCQRVFMRQSHWPQPDVICFGKRVAK